MAIIRMVYNWFTQLQILATFLITFLAVILVLLTTNVIAVTYSQVSSQVAQDQYRRLASAAGERLSSSLENYMLGLTTLAVQAEMQSGEPTLQQLTLERGADLVASFTNQDAGVIILDDNGVVSVTKPFRPDLIGKNLSDEPYFKDAQSLRIGSFSGILAEPGTNKAMIVVTTPIVDGNDTFIGAISGRLYIDFRGLSSDIEGVRLNQDTQIYAVDNGGRLIYHPFQGLIGQDFSHQPAVRRLLRGELTGAVEQILEETADPTIQGFASIPISNWGVVVSGPRSSAVEPVYRVLRPAGEVLVIGLVLISVIVSWGMNRVTQPIRSLVNQIRHVTKGDYDAQVELSRIKELRDLGEASNHMVEQIRRYRAGTRQYIVGVTRSQEEERKRIARDLHDDTVQSLIAVGQRLDLVKSMLDEPEEAHKRLTDLRKMVNQTIANVRQFSRDLRPLALEDLGLLAALQYLVSDLTQKTEIEANLELIGEASNLPSDMDVAIYRILQETLSNVRKHAQATRVEVTVEFTQLDVILTVADNGRGFEMPEALTDFASEGHLGMMGLQERAQLFGGSITVEAQPDQGTIVKLVMPRQVSLSPFEIYHLPYLQGAKVAEEPMVAVEQANGQTVH